MDRPHLPAPLVALLLAFGALFAGPAALAADPVFVDTLPDGTRAAIRGYDPVAYFTLGAPVLGSAQHTLEWNGATWRFANAMNRDRFKMNPERYAPQYGGYCAFGTSRGYKVSTQPDQWAVVDGKLYLNYNAGVMQTWDKDRAFYIEKADTNWRTLVEEPYESDAAAAERIRKKRAEATARASGQPTAGSPRGR